LRYGIIIKQKLKKLLCNVYRISLDSVYPTLTYCKIKVRSTQKMNVKWIFVLKLIKVETVYCPVYKKQLSLSP